VNAPEERENYEGLRGHVARMGEKRNTYRILVGNPDGKRPLGRPRRRWVDNIKMVFTRGSLAPILS
jgi:hypothetical protein